MVQELAGYSLYPAASHFNCNNDNEFDKNYQSKKSDVSSDVSPHANGVTCL